MKMGKFFISIFSIICLLGTSHCAIRDSIQEVFDDYFDWVLRSRPEFASLLGYHEKDDRLTDYSLPALVRRELVLESFKRKSQSILEQQDLSNDEKQYVNLLHYIISRKLRGIKRKEYMFAPIDFKAGIQIKLPRNFKKSSFFKLDSIQDFSNVIARLNEIPQTIKDIIEVLKSGIKEGITYSKESIDKVPSQLEHLQMESIEDSSFLAPFKNIDVEKFDAESIDKIRGEAKDIVVSKVLPAFKELHTFIKEEYSKHVRPAAGLWSMPNGRKFYKERVEHFVTTTEYTPKEIYDIGMESIAELKQAVMQIAENLGLGNKSFIEFLEFIRTSPELQFKTKEEGLSLFRSIIYDKINPILNQVIPEEYLVPEVYNVDVDVPPSTSGSTAYYVFPARDGSRNGTFYVNLNNLNVFQKTTCTTLALHETNPGHHFQSVFSGSSNFPRFLENSYFTAHSEGWGLYSEYLGNELGLYKNDPYQLLGFYSYNLLRSARLVVDTGIHFFEWDRDRAIDFLIKNTAFSKDYIELQVDRYISMPGQALAYRMGEIEIRKLRKIKEKEDNFDLKQYHVDFLSCKGPLDLLAECIELKENKRNLESSN